RTVSEYDISNNGVISLRDGPVSAGQSAACWAVVTDNEKYIYAANTGSGNISSFNGKHGDLSVLQAIAGVTGTGTSPADVALSNNSKFLYVRNGGNGTIYVYSVENHGGLNYLQTV